MRWRVHSVPKILFSLTYELAKFPQVTKYLKSKKKSLQKDDTKSIKNALLSGNRVALGKAITLIESNRAEDRSQAGDLLSSILEFTGKSIRIGITGVPGVGKSTFIEALGELITGLGKKLAVLAIDPSSAHSKGSILGDKTRMGNLSTNPNAFIRPTAASGELGGVANKTNEAILLCEAAGYDVVLIETVGVGQSEVAVKNMTDVFLLLMLAGAGDELQGIKRGIMEMADILIINKADGNNTQPAQLAKKAYENAIHLFSARESGWTPPVLTCSSLEHSGINNVWDTIQEFHKQELTSGGLIEKRQEQKLHWLEKTLNTELVRQITQEARIAPTIKTLKAEVLSNKITPHQAVDKILAHVFKQ